MKLVFEDAFNQCTQAPLIIWVADWEKGHRLILRLCATSFGADHGTPVRQDWRHFKEILLAHADCQDSGYGKFKRDVEGLLKQIHLPDDAIAYAPLLPGWGGS